MLRHLAHTVGANQVFVDLALAARHVTRAGGDDSLLEWRSAAACARGTCQPDGFGCYRRGDANDPETYSMAITAILTRFPQHED